MHKQGGEAIGVGGGKGGGKAGGRKGADLFQHSKNTYFIHPKIQHEDLRVNRELLRVRTNASVLSIACMTPARQDIVNTAILERLAEKNLGEMLLLLVSPDDYQLEMVLINTNMYIKCILLSIFIFHIYIPFLYSILRIYRCFHPHYTKMGIYMGWYTLLSSAQ